VNQYADREKFHILIKLSSNFKHKLDGLQQRNTRKVKCIFGECCPRPWPFNLWPWKCHQCRMDLITSLFKICPCILEISKKNASQSVCLTMCGLSVTLTYDLLTSKSNQFIFVPNCTKAVNVEKFLRVGCKIFS